MDTTLKQRLQADLADARKARDKALTLVLSTTLSEVRNREIDRKSEAGDEMVTEVLVKAIKQRRDSADQMRDAGRSELAEKEEAEAAVLARYLPDPMSEEEVRTLIRTLISEGASEMGPLMGALMPRIKGRFNGKEANRLVREELSG